MSSYKRTVYRPEDSGVYLFEFSRSNISHPYVLKIYIEWRNEHGIPHGLPLTDDQRAEFEEYVHPFIIKYYRDKNSMAEKKWS